MVGRRFITVVFMGAVALCATVRADMVLLPPIEAGSRPSLLTTLPAEPQLPRLWGSYADFVGVTDLGPLPVGFVPPSRTGAGQSGAAQPAPIVADQQNSLTLFLYALLSLGLSRSVPAVKHLHFGCIPDWYYSSGPSQIGHSFALSPDCLPSAPVIFFIQPDREAEFFPLPYLSGAVAALLRNSQFILIALPARGPPNLTHESSIA
jgi:hypothetical protein